MCRRCHIKRQGELEKTTLEGVMAGKEAEASVDMDDGKDITCISRMATVSGRIIEYDMPVEEKRTA